MSLEKFCQIEDAGVIAVPIPMENFRPQQQTQQPVNFSSCQQILMKTFQNDANTPLITKTALKFVWTFGPRIVPFLGLGKSHIK